MGSTLQEQFLKMGLVNKKQVEKTKKRQHQNKALKYKKADEIKIGAKQALEEKKTRSQLLNQKKTEGAKEQESASRIRQLIETNRVAIQEGDTPYNFTDNNKIKRLYLQKNLVERLSKGDLAIVKQAGEYHIIPADTARKVREYNRKLIVVYHTPGRPQTGDDPYAEYTVPDDLMW